MGKWKLPQRPVGEKCWGWGLRDGTHDCPANDPCPMVALRVPMGTMLAAPEFQFPAELDGRGGPHLPYMANTSLISFSITRSAASMPYVLAIAWMSLE